MRVPISEQLIARLRAQGVELPEGVRLRRINPSRSMRANGSWSWTLEEANGWALPIGSQYPVSRLLACEGTLDISTTGDRSWSDTHVDPCWSCTTCRLTS